MISESYDYVALDNKTEYFFASKSKKGGILKSVQFTPFEGNVWNIAFGDYNEGDLDDSIISNNHDIVKIFNTIAKIIYEYSDKFPSHILFINPVDDKRKQLYNHIFRRHYETIDIIFDITGSINRKEEVYSPQKKYDTFKLKRKFVQ